VLLDRIGGYSRYSIRSKLEIGWMGFKENKEYWFIALLLILSICIRIPVTPHQMGFDSFGIQLNSQRLSNSHNVHISFRDHYAIDENPSDSLYPLMRGDKAVTLTILSLIHQFSGIGMEHVILLYSNLIGVLIVFSGYMLAKEFLDNRVFIFFTVLGISITPVVLIGSIWTASTRSLFLVYLMAFLWSLIRYDNTRRRKYLIGSFCILLFLIFTHKMSMIVMPLFFVYVIYRVVLYINGMLQVRFRSLSKYFPFIIQVGVAVAFSVSLLYPFTQNTGMLSSIKEDYRTGILTDAQEGEGERIFLNMVVDYITSEGFLFIFMPLGLIIAITRIKSLEKNRRYLLFCLMTLPNIMFLLVGEYMTVFMVPFFSICSGLAMKGLVNAIRVLDKAFDIKYSVVPIFIILLVVLSMIGSYSMLTYWIFRVMVPGTEATIYMRERTKHLADFLEERDGVVTSGYMFLDMQLAPQFKEDRMAYGGPYVYSHSIVDGVTQEHIGRDLLRYGSWNMFFVEYKPMKGRILWSHQPSWGYLYYDLFRHEDRVYDNGLENIWYVRFSEDYLETAKKKEHVSKEEWIEFVKKATG